MARPSKGDEFELTIKSIVFGGRGLGYFDDYVVFVRGGLPDQRLLVCLTKRCRKYGEARILSVLHDSPNGVIPQCNHFGICGGCSFQHFRYSAQVEQKIEQVLDIFRRIGQVKTPTLESVISAEKTYNYRNKMEFTFSNRRWLLEQDNGENVDFALGLHIPRRFDKILEINNCELQSSIANEILTVVRKTALEEKMTPYDIREHTGFLRNLIIRIGERTDEMMVNIVTAKEDTNLLVPLVNRIIEVHPSVTSIVNNITRRKAGVSYGEWEVLLYGRPNITDKLGGFTFEISANSFFQTNTVQAEKLYQLAQKFGDFQGNEVLYDLYSGIGSTSIFMAQYVEKVYGFEGANSAVEDAVRNAVSNSVVNCRFFTANLDRFFRESSILSEIDSPDVVLLDPPRAGIHPKLVTKISEMAPKKILYISCNPSTQARDVDLLSSEGFSLKKLGMVDMFPHTPNIETVVLMEEN